MPASLTHIVVFGLPLALYFGIITFLCLLTTALLGFFVLKGLYNIPFRWHMRMAAVTIFFAIIHVLLVILQYFF
jgi:thiosulfate reductase cytochrome b subunit